MTNNLQFNSSDELPPLPEISGTYTIAAIRETVSKKQEGVNITWKILDGNEAAGTQFVQYYGIWATNVTSNRIARSNFKEIEKAIKKPIMYITRDGVDKDGFAVLEIDPQHSDGVIGMTLKAEIITDGFDDRGNPQIRIKKYFPEFDLTSTTERGSAF